MPADPVSENADGFPVPGSIDQVTGPGVPPGSRSVRVTPCAVPVPPLWIATVNPIGSPALTDAASAVLVTVTAAGRHAVDAQAFRLPSLGVVTLAVVASAPPP